MNPKLTDQHKGDETQYKTREEDHNNIIKGIYDPSSRLCEGVKANREELLYQLIIEDGFYN